MRSGGPLVVSFRRMPLFDMLSRPAVVTGAGGGFAARGWVPCEPGSDGAICPRGRCMRRTRTAVGAWFFQPGLYSAEGSGGQV